MPHNEKTLLGKGDALDIRPQPPAMGQIGIDGARHAHILGRQELEGGDSRHRLGHAGDIRAHIRRHRGGGRIGGGARLAEGVARDQEPMVHDDVGVAHRFLVDGGVDLLPPGREGQTLTVDAIARQILVDDTARIAGEDDRDHEDRRNGGGGGGTPVVWHALHEHPPQSRAANFRAATRVGTRPVSARTHRTLAIFEQFDEELLVRQVGCIPQREEEAIPGVLIVGGVPRRRDEKSGIGEQLQEGGLEGPPEGRQIGVGDWVNGAEGGARSSSHRRIPCTAG